MRICPKSKLPVPYYSPATLSSHFSMFKKFWEFTGRENLDEQAPVIRNNMKKWRKAGGEIKKAKIFDNSQLRAMYAIESDDPEWITIKAFVATASSYAARSENSHMMQFEEFQMKKVVQKNDATK
jgi:hypothetical protein